MSAYKEVIEAEVIEQHRDHLVDDLLQSTAMVRHSSSAEEYAALVRVVGLQPRDPARMVAEAKRIGSLLGQSGFYRFPAGKGVIQGPTIDLAYALAQAWGRCITRCVLVDTVPGRATIRGVFVDMLTGSICERDYVGHMTDAPGRFDEARWETMQLQSAISKAVRGAILGGLPAWYVDAGYNAAIAAANADVLRGDDNKPMTLEAARALALDYWAGKGASRAMLEAYLGIAVDLWSVIELTRLVDAHKAIVGGSSTIERFRAECQAVLTPQAPAEGRDAAGVPRRAAKPDPKPEPKADPKPAKPVETSNEAPV